MCIKKTGTIPSSRVKSLKPKSLKCLYSPVEGESRSSSWRHISQLIHEEYWGDSCTAVYIQSQSPVIGLIQMISLGSSRDSQRSVTCERESSEAYHQKQQDKTVQKKGDTWLCVSVFKSGFIPLSPWRRRTPQSLYRRHFHRPNQICQALPELRTKHRRLEQV